MKTCRVTKALRFQCTEIKYALTLAIVLMLGSKSSRAFPSLPLRDWFTRCDEKEGGSGEICPTTTNLLIGNISLPFDFSVVPTCNHDGEFEPLLDTLAKNLIGKIRKPHIALHSFSTLSEKNKQLKLIFRHNKTASQQTNRKWKLYLPLLSKFFWSKPSCIHTHSVFAEERRQKTSQD